MVAFIMEKNMLWILGIVFITLRLIGIITWSWIWVIAPIWIPTVLCIFLKILIELLEGKRWLQIKKQQSKEV
jgi:hypothetical protein